MNSQYRRHYTQGSHTSMRFLFSGDGYQNKNDFQMRKQFEEQAEAAKHLPPKSETETHEDRQVFIGLINGVLIGGLISGVGGYLAKWSVITIIFAIFGGVVVGGLLGAMIARLIIWINNRTKKPGKKDNQSTHV